MNKKFSVNCNFNLNQKQNLSLEQQLSKLMKLCLPNCSVYADYIHQYRTYDSSRFSQCKNCLPGSFILCYMLNREKSYVGKKKVHSKKNVKNGSHFFDKYLIFHRFFKIKGQKSSLEQVQKHFLLNIAQIFDFTC